MNPGLHEARTGEHPELAEVAAWKRANVRLSQLCTIGQALTRMETVERSIPEILDLVGATLPLRTALLLLEDPGSLRSTRARLWHAEGVSTHRRQAADGHARRAYAYLSPDTHTAAIEEQSAVLYAAPGRDTAAQGPHPSAGFVLLPLVVDRHRIFGALQLEGAAALDETDLRFLGAVVNHLAIALDRLAAVQARQAHAAAGQSAAETRTAAAQHGEHV